MDPAESSFQDFEQFAIDNLPTLASTTDTDSTEQPSVNGDDGTDEIIPESMATIRNDLGVTSDNRDNDDGHSIINESLVSVDNRNRFETLPTVSTTARSSLVIEDQQNNSLHIAPYLNDATNQLLHPSTSATTTSTTSTTDTQTDAHFHYMDQRPGTNNMLDDNNLSSQQQLNDTQSLTPQQDDNSNIISLSIPTTPTLDHQSLTRTVTVGSDEQTLSEPAGPRHEWESDRQAPECRRCGRRFNFLIRRHHCRRCGQIVCDRCSPYRVRLPVEEIVEDPLISTSHYPTIALNPQRVCEACIRIPIKADPSSASHYSTSASNSISRYSKSTNAFNQQHYPMNMQRSNSQQSLMVECPVCGNGLLGMRKEQQEYHLNRCLNTGSPTVRPPRYIIYTLMEGAAQVGDECPICFEEFAVGNKIARMVCLCSYHRRCLRTWLKRGKGCPIHYDSNIETY